MAGAALVRAVMVVRAVATLLLLECAMTLPRYLPVLVALTLGAISFGWEYFGPIAAVAQDSTKEVLAAQIRSQGVVCNKALRATRDARRSKPDHEVWVLQCDNASYRVSRYPDLAAKIERLR